MIQFKSKQLTFLLFLLITAHGIKCFAQAENNEKNNEISSDPELIEPIFDFESNTFKTDPSSSFQLMRWRIIQKDELPKIETYDHWQEELENEKLNEVFKIQEYETNYITMGKPDTKVQFSFKFKILKNTDLYFGYTQIMFWDLFRKESNPFSEINFNPELFYRWSSEDIFFKDVDLGVSHLSNGKDGDESRSVDSLYLRLMTFSRLKIGIPRIQLTFRYLYNEDKTNKDINEYYGPVLVKLYFDKLGKKIFNSEELYFEYYNGGFNSNDLSRNSVRLSARFKIFKSAFSPKVFVQYFNGYGENLSNYNSRNETYRIGFSIGGF